MFTTTNKREYVISLKVKRNFAPTMTDLLNQTIGTYRLPNSYVTTFWYQNFTDAEGDNVIIDCSNIDTDSVGGSAWVNEDQNVSGAGNITLYGTTPRNNDYAGDYVYMCQVYD